MLGFEGSRLVAWSLARRHYNENAVVIGESADEAEEIYFHNWRGASAVAPPPPPPPPPPPVGASEEPQRLTTAIIDYGSGNLHSAVKAFERAAREGGDIRGDILVTDDPDVVRRSERVVLPGVGAFADCRRGLAAISGMDAALTEAVIDNGRPFLGICVGMQLMATRGLNMGKRAGWTGSPETLKRSNPPIPRSKSRTWDGTP